jgi:hypothetical protein
MLPISSMDELQQQLKNDFIVVIASTKTCTVCTHTKGMIQRMMHGTPLTPFEVDIDEVPLFRGEHLVFTVPTVLVFSHGKELYRSSRFIDYAQLDKIITHHLG